MNKEVMEQAQHRLPRLLDFICEIKLNPRQTPEQLYQKLGISRSQFFEDKKALAKIGFVFDYERSKGRYVIKKDKYLPVTDLTPLEALSLIMAVRQISAAGDHTLAFDAVRAVKKIISNSNEHVRELLEYALDETVFKKKFMVDSAIVDEIWQAIEKSMRLEIRYQNFSKGKEVILSIDPYALYFKGRALYLDVYSVDEQKVLMLRVSRIKQILRHLGNFSQREDYNFRERHSHSYRVMTSENPPQMVKIRFSPKAAPYIDEIHHHDSEKKRWFADGSIVLSLTVSEPKEVLWYLVLPWGAEAEILEPEWLRGEAIRVAQKILTQYQTAKEVKR